MRKVMKYRMKLVIDAVQFLPWELKGINSSFFEGYPIQWDEKGIING